VSDWSNNPAGEVTRVNASGGSGSRRQNHMVIEKFKKRCSGRVKHTWTLKKNEESGYSGVTGHMRRKLV
jgi:hypothetical protein